MSAHNKRDLIVETLQKLEQSLPSDASRATHECRKLADRLAYTAPELMDLFWSRLYTFLQKEVPWRDSVLIWNAANEKYKEFN